MKLYNLLLVNDLEPLCQRGEGYASGSGVDIKFAKKSMRLVRYGCANRPFYHIVVMLKGRNQHEVPIEQLGTYDPMPNERNEKLISFNYERIRYWLGQGSDVSDPVAELLGLSGFFPVHPRTYMTAWRGRHKARQEAEKAETSDKTVEQNQNN